MNILKLNKTGVDDVIRYVERKSKRKKYNWKYVCKRDDSCLFFTSSKVNENVKENVYFCVFDKCWDWSWGEVKFKKVLVFYNDLPIACFKEKFKNFSTEALFDENLNNTKLR